MLGKWELDSVNCADALELLRGLPDGSVNLLASDPPFNIGKASWDSWVTVDSFLAWLDEHLREMRRVLAPNGSLYLFCATKYAARVELAVGAHFNVLNNLRWEKPPHSTKAEMFDKETMRAFFPASESVIFAELSQVDYLANGAAYEPLKTYFRGQAKSCGIGSKLFNETLGFATTGSGMAGTIIGDKDEFIMPSLANYERMQAAFPNVWTRPYYELRYEYETLKQQYEALRRPFNATPDAPYTDVWRFATVNTYPGKHPCEKPLDMCRHIVTVSSRTGDVVCDPFAGSGVMLRAAKLEGRHYVGGDNDPYWVRRTVDSLRLPFEPRAVVREARLDDLPLFSVASAESEA